MVITDTLEGRTAWCRPLHATGLRLADYEVPMDNPSKPYPFGLEGAGSAYQNIIHHLFIDHTERNHIDDLYMIDLPEAGRPAPMINMVSIRQLLDDSLHNVLEDSPGDYFEGLTKTIKLPHFPSRVWGHDFPCHP